MTYETVLEFKKMLTNLDGWMAKAAAFADHKKFDVNTLTQARLAPDMYPFVKQVQSTCDAAKFCAAHLSMKEAPKHEDNETTWADCRARIKKATAFLDTLKPEDFGKAATAKVAPKWANGKWFTGMEYLHEVAVPNFFFHCTTAYAILRHSGVDLGKMDYLGSINMRD